MDFDVAGRMRMREVGAAARRHVRHGVGAGGMDRHARRNRRAPACVRARVEECVALQRLEATFGVAAGLDPDARRMALGGRGHALRAPVDARDLAAGEPCRDADERLNETT